MISVNEEVKDYLKSDNYLVDMSVTFPNGDHQALNNEQIVDESMKFTESFCSRDEFKFGLCEASMIEFDADLEEDIIDKEIDVTLNVKKSIINAESLEDELTVNNPAFEVELKEISVNSIFNFRSQIFKLNIDTSKFIPTFYRSGSESPYETTTINMLNTGGRIENIYVGFKSRNSDNVIVSDDVSVDLITEDMTILSQASYAAPSGRVGVKLNHLTHQENEFVKIQTDIETFNHIYYAYIPETTDPNPSYTISDLIFEYDNFTEYIMPKTRIVNGQRQTLIYIGIEAVPYYPPNSQSAPHYVGGDVYDYILNGKTVTRVYQYKAVNRISINNYYEHLSSVDLSNHIIRITTDGTIKDAFDILSSKRININNANYDITDNDFSNNPKLVFTFVDASYYTIEYIYTQQTYQNQYPIKLGKYLVDSCEKENDQSTIRHIVGYSPIARKNWELPRSFVEVMNSSSSWLDYDFKLTAEDMQYMLFPEFFKNTYGVTTIHHNAVANANIDLKYAIPTESYLCDSRGGIIFSNPVELLMPNTSKAGSIFCENMITSSLNLTFKGNGKADLTIDAPYYGSELDGRLLYMQPFKSDGTWDYNRVFVNNIIFYQVNDISKDKIHVFRNSPEYATLRIRGHFATTNGDMAMLSASNNHTLWDKFIEYDNDLKNLGYVKAPQQPAGLQGRLIQNNEDMKKWCSPCASMMIPKTPCDYIKYNAKDSSMSSNVIGYNGRINLDAYEYFEQITTKDIIFAFPRNVSYEVVNLPSGYTGTAQRWKSNLVGKYFCYDESIEGGRYAVSMFDQHGDGNFRPRNSAQSYILGEFDNQNHIVWIPSEIYYFKNGSAAYPEKRAYSDTDVYMRQRSFNSGGLNYERFVLQNSQTWSMKKRIDTDKTGFFYNPMNDAYSTEADIKRYIIPENIQKYFEGTLELKGFFGKFYRNGDFRQVRLSPRQEIRGLTPSDSLVPSDTLVPRNFISSQEEYTMDDYVLDSLKTNDKKAYMFDSIACEYIDENGNTSLATRQIKNDIIGDDIILKTYTIKDNEVLKNTRINTSQMESILYTMAGNLRNVIFYPLRVTAKGLPYVEAGDKVAIEFEDTAYDTYVLRRTLSGIQDMKDEIESL